MDFVAIDFETANPNMASICQIGVATFRQGQLDEKFSSLIDPADYFSGRNVAIHGIDAGAVVGAPTFPDVYPRLAELLGDRIVVSHTPFDRSALEQVLIRYGLPEIDCRWLDSARVVRRTWHDCAQSGYGLGPVAAKLGIVFGHHDAFEDARAAGEILVRAIIESGVGVEEWLVKSYEPIVGSGNSLNRDGNPSRWFP